MVGDLTGTADRQRLDARRGDRGGRGDARWRFAIEGHQDRTRPHPCVADDCHPQTAQPWCAPARHPLGMDASPSFAPGDTAVDRRGAALRGPFAVSGHRSGVVRDLRAAHRSQAHAAGRPGDRMRCDLLSPDRAPDAAGRDAAPTSRSVARSASACPMGFGGPHAALPRHAATSSSATCPDASSACRKDTAGPPGACAWPCRPANSTSAARRPPPTSAPPRRCWPMMAAMYAVYHGPEGLTRHRPAARNLASLHAGGRRLGACLVHAAA